MSKKKKKQPLPPEEIAVSPEQLEEAKRIISALNADIQHSLAKKRLMREMPCAKSLANAIVVKLIEEGFEGGESGWFRHPDAPAATGVVQGARRPGDMKIAPQGVEGAEIELSPTAHHH